MGVGGGRVVLHTKRDSLPPMAIIRVNDMGVSPCVSREFGFRLLRLENGIYISIISFGYYLKLWIRNKDEGRGAIERGGGVYLRISLNKWSGTGSRRDDSY